VVRVGRSLAVGTQVVVMTDSALVAHTDDVSLTCAAPTVRAVAVYPKVAGSAKARCRKLLIDGREAMTNVDLMHVLDTVGAEIIIWTVEAFVTNAQDGLVAAVTGSQMHLVAPRTATSSRRRAQCQVLVDGLEFVSGVVAMLGSIVTM
jgi:hypothetical protein